MEIIIFCSNGVSVRGQSFCIQTDYRFLGIVIEQNVSLSVFVELHVRVPIQGTSVVLGVRKWFLTIVRIVEILAYIESFKDITGQSIDAFVKEIRMNKAEDLLEDESLSIGEIAHGLGYMNQGKFSTAFKMRKGIGPLEYRKRIKNLFKEA